MPYIGNFPAESYSQVSYQDLTGGSGTSFTLDYPVGSAGEIEVFINNVRQEPTVAYTVSGTSLTMTGSVSATDDFYVVFQGKNQQSIGIPEKQSNGDYNFDSSTLFIDSSTSSVGIGTASPSSALDVDVSQDAETNIELTNTNTGSAAQVRTKYTTDGGLFTVGKVSDAHVYGGDAYLWNVDNTGIRFATSDTQRMVIDSSGNVGIGTSTTTGFDSGADDLIIGSGSGSTGMTIYSGAAGYGSLHFADVNSSPANYVGYVNYNHSTNSMQFATNNSEAMRIDSSGNLLVGKSSDSFGTAGAAYRSNGSISATANANEVLDLNRLTSDGNIMRFFKDSTSVGSIGYGGGGILFNAASNYGFKFYDAGGTNVVHPATTSGADKDNSVDLGYSGSRFKDLYLSGGVLFDGVTKLQGNAYIVGGSATNGIRFNNNNDSQNNVIMNDDGTTWFRSGIYLGATSNPSSANLMDDYEEGTWTPTLTFSGGSGLAYTLQSGSYVKIGDVVTAQFRIQLSSLGSSTGGATFGGLPFNATSVGTLYPAFYGLHHDVNSGSGGSTANVLPIGQIVRGANYWNYYNADSTTTIGAAYFNNNSVINGTVTFRVN